MQAGKLLRISDFRSIYIFENLEGGYIAQDGSIQYRNIGSSFNISEIHTAYTQIEEETIHVLDPSGNSKFYFSKIWLDTIFMKMLELQELGIITFSEK
jgi:hypothetical protein